VVSLPDGPVLESPQLAFGEVWPLDVPLNGTPRIRLRMQSVASGVDPYDSKVPGAWAEPTLTR
jgi:hypothetical protein